MQGAFIFLLMIKGDNTMLKEINEYTHLKPGNIVRANLTEFDLTEGKEYVVQSGMGVEDFPDCFKVLNDKGELIGASIEYFDLVLDDDGKPKTDYKLKCGVYMHYKGKKYVAIDVCYPLKEYRGNPNAHSDFIAYDATGDALMRKRMFLNDGCFYAGDKVTVLYRQIDGEQLFLRKYEDFIGEVFDGIKRFTYIERNL